MSLPHYKYIQVNSSNQRMIYAQLNQIKFELGPYVFIVETLGDKQAEAISNIDQYITGHRVSIFPYAPYIIGNASDYKGKILVVSAKEDLPFFFKVKSRPLGTKESVIMNKIDLKRKNLQNMNSIEYNPVLKEYARTHKIINQLQKENNFLEDIINNTGGEHV